MKLNESPFWEPQARDAWRERRNNMIKEIQMEAMGQCRYMVLEPMVAALKIADQTHSSLWRSGFDMKYALDQARSNYDEQWVMAKTRSENQEVLWGLALLQELAAASALRKHERRKAEEAELGTR